MSEPLPVASVSIVVPVFNEEGNLRLLNEELKAQANARPETRFEFIFIDDGSRDASRSILRELAGADKRVTAIFFNRNYGQTAAMSCGISLATGDVIIPMDADLQNDPADIPLFLKKIQEGFDCVSGWRKNRKDDLVVRKLPSWIANSLISWLTRVHLHDYGCSMKAYRREMIQEVALYGEMHRFIPAYAAWSGAKVTEIVVNHRPRVHGTSKYGLSRIFKVLLDLVVIKFLTVYFNKPMHFFGTIGFMSFGLGLLAELAAVVYKISGLKDFVQTPLPVIGAVFLIVGVQCILFGLIAEVLMRTYYEAQGRKPYVIKECIGHEQI